MRGHKNAARRAIEIHGRDVTLVSRTASGSDDYGDATFSESSETVRARVIRNKAPQNVGSESGEYVQADVEIHLSDSHSVDDTAPESLFRVDSQEYEVVRVDDQDSGLQVAECRRRN